MTPEQKKAIQQILDAMKILDWSVAIPSGGGSEDDSKVHGLILGEQAYLDYILGHLE